MKGTHGAAPRSKQALVLSGLLQGLKNERCNGLFTRLQHELVISVNLSLRNNSSRSAVVDRALVIAVSQVFDLLGISAKHTLDHDLLLPTLTEAVFLSGSGLHQGFFLGTMDADVLETLGKKFDWSAKSHSYLQLQSTASGPLVAEMGRLSRLAAFLVEHVTNWMTLSRLLKDLFEFSRSLCVQWRQNKLSEVDALEENLFLSDNTIEKTLPLLWRVLRSGMFSMLQVLRNMAFISSHFRLDALSQYCFVYSTAVDVISQYPMFAEALLKQLRPTEIGVIPQHPLDRCLDTFFLNTAEHFIAVLNTQVADDLVANAASPYLGSNAESNTFEAFEAAHSVMLAIMAVPHNVALAASRIEDYAERLFEVFPQSLSTRQFHFAFTQLIRIASPPSLIWVQRPLLPCSLLETIRFRVESASTEPLAHKSNTDEVHAQPMSEKAALVLALIQSLPCLELEALEAWLPVAARLCYVVQDPDLRQVCRNRLWEVISNGAMDVNRAAFCANWWNTRSGRELALYGEEKPVPGSLIDDSMDELSRL
ncbi:MAG: hypothetical protein Q9180_000648 [Flavoplaca navasiana]